MTSKLEYLQKYMSAPGSSGDKKKKKIRKKGSSSTHQGLRIHDSDVHLAELQPRARSSEANDWKNSEDEEDRPTIVRLEEPERSERAVGKALGSWEEVAEELHKKKGGDRKIEDRDQDVSPPRRKRLDSDPSPPRRRRLDSDPSPPRRRRLDSDTSPPRQGMSAADSSPPRRRRLDSDTSSPRKNRETRGAALSVRNTTTDYSATDGRSNSELPSSSRKRRLDSDASPPRQGRQVGSSSSRRRPANESLDLLPNKGDRDASPQRRTRQNSDASPPRRRKGDPSPPRRARLDSDASPPRRGGGVGKTSIRRKRLDSGTSPSRLASASPGRPNPNARTSKVDGGENEERNKTNQRQEKTGAGFTAGLHTGSSFSAQQRGKLAEEKRKLANLAEDQLGKDTETVYRDARGRKLDMLTEMMRQRDILEGKAKKEAQEEYEWGTGKVQKREVVDKHKELEELKEQPFARYINDERVDNELRNRILADDPMAEYVKKNAAKRQGKPLKPVYKGPPPPPNRFGILPGHRWDGIVRGNNWEQRVIAHQTKKTAQKEEAYLWSVQDM